MTDLFPPTVRERVSNQLNVRLADAGRDWIAKQMKAHNVSQSEIVKSALAFAASQPEKFSEHIEGRKR